MVNWMKATSLELMGMDVCDGCISPGWRKTLNSCQRIEMYFQKNKTKKKKHCEVPLLRYFLG